MKKFIFFFLLSIIIYFSFFSISRLTIGGVWKINEIVLNNKNIQNSDNKEEINLVNSFKRKFESVIINDWDKTIVFNKSDTDSIIRIQFKIKYDDKNNPYLLLSSKEKYLNGIFKIKIDTFYNTGISLKEVRLNLKIQSKKCSLNLHRTLESIKIDNSIKRGRP